MPGDGYPNKTIGYLNIIIKCVMLLLIIPDESIITDRSTTTSVLTSSSKYHSDSIQYNFS